MKRMLCLLLVSLLCTGCSHRAETPTLPSTVPSVAPSTEPVTEPTAEPTAEPTTQPTTQPTTLPPKSPARQLLESMTLEQMVQQLFIVTPEQMYDGLQPGGVILFAQNIQTPSQCMDLIQKLQDSVQVSLFIAVDEEGGTVARVGSNSAMGTTSFPDMASVTTPEEAYGVGNTIARELRELGFNLDFAPVADVNSNPDNPVIGKRSFGSEPDHVARQVASAVEGFRDGGMLCTLKHFPGHGDTGTDSHEGYTQVDKTLEQLRQTEFVPFQAGIQAGAPFVMVGHLALPKVTGNAVPATLSPEILAILRQELGFQGVIVTDAMNMGAITDAYSSAQAAVLALEAGVDVILMPEDVRSAIQGVLEAVDGGQLSRERIEESVLRILEAKFASGILG